MNEFKMAKKLVKNIKDVSKFIKSPEDSISVRNNKLTALTHFYLANNIGLKKMILIAKKEQIDKVPFKNTKLKIWLDVYDKYLKKRYSDGSQNLWDKYVRKFFEGQGIMIQAKDGFYPIIKKQKTGYLTKRDIEIILDACKSLKMKAIILTQLSTGLSPKFILNLKIKDFKNGMLIEKIKICKLDINRADGDKFIAFISNEAVEAIEEYLKSERKTIKPEDPLFSNHINGKLSLAGLQKAYRELNKQIDWSYKNNKKFKVTPSMVSNYFKIHIGSKILKSTIGYLTGKKSDLNPDENILIKDYQKNVELVTINYLNINTLRAKYHDLEEKMDEIWQLVDDSIDFIENEEVTPCEELFEDYKKLSEAFYGIQSLNETNEWRIELLERKIKNKELEIEELKAKKLTHLLPLN